MTDLPEWIADTLGPVEEVHASFLDSDSGNLSWGLRTRRKRLFVKLATTEAARDGLIRAATLHHAVQHPGIVPLDQVLRSVYGTALVFPWVEGRNLYAPANKRRRRRSAPGRFRELSLGQRLAAVDTVLDAHLAVVGAGFVSGDFYDGNWIYDFDAHQLHLVDFDEYRSGPWEVAGERAFGSERFLAPEERIHGGRIDERTTVYHLGRAASILLDEGDDTGAFVGPAPLEAIAAKAQQPEPDRRFGTVSALVDAWRAAREAP